MPRNSRALRGVARLLRLEGRLTRVVQAAMRAWLDAVREAVLPAHGVPDPAAGGHAASVWERAVEDDVVPVLTTAFGEEFRHVSGQAQLPHTAFQEDFLHDARSRLRAFPDSAWADVQPEIAEALRSGRPNRELAERIGWILDFDQAGGDGSQARSRQLQAEIADLDQRLRSGTLTPAQERELRGQRADDHELLQISDRRWRYRAERIARTEAAAAQNGGALAAARATSQQTGEQLFKQWMATTDERTRHTHRVAGGLEDEAGIATPGGRGQIVPAAAPFHVGAALLQFPGDPAGPPGEVINCRCTITFLDQGEAMDNGYDPRGLTGPQLAALTAADTPPDDTADDGPSGAIVALLPADPDGLTVPDGDPADQLHCTVLYLTPDADTIGPDEYGVLDQVLQQIATQVGPITAPVSTVGELGDDDPPATVMHLDDGDDNALQSMRSLVKGTAIESGVPVPEDTYPTYRPHVTLGYGLDPADHQDRVGSTVTLDRLALMRAGQVTTYPLGGAMPTSPAAPGDQLTAAAPLAPPKTWFTDPGLPAPTPLRVETDGRVYGHLAAWGTPHASFPGQNVTAPKSATGYAHFHVGDVLTQEGDLLPVGRLTLGTGHAEPGLGMRAAAEHYDHTGACVAVVRAGEDRHGIWVAGSLVPGVSDEQAAELRRSPLSGDWRRAGGNLELVAALAVNVPGFAIPRPQLELAASGRREELSLCAAGVVAREQDPAVMVDVPALARAVVAEQRAQGRREELVASLTTRVGLDPASRLRRVTDRVEGMR